ncbi:MAG: hypothetical protein PHS98_04620 [Bacilli bacterium]|nr:hypothetical protein [Bacilli bacterium]
MAGEKVTIGDEIYEFVAAAADVTEENIAVVVGEVLTADNAVEQLAKTINANSAIVTGVADKTDDICVISYNAVGTAGNAVTVAETLTNASFGTDVTKLSGGQYGTPCPIKDTMVYITPYYYWCEVAGNKDDVAWKRFTPASY